MFRLGELAARLGARLEGDPERAIEAVRGLEDAGSADLAFLTDSRHLEAARSSAAGALCVLEGTEGLAGDVLFCTDPEVARIDALRVLHPGAKPGPGVHPTAIVGRGTEIAAGASVGPYAVVGERCVVEDGVVIGSHVCLGHEVKVRSGARIRALVSVYDGCEIGENVEIHSGAVVGADGHGYVRRDGRYRKVPQVGTVTLEEDVEIGANSTVDRATLGETRIGRGTKIDNLVQVGHNVDVGEDGMLCAQAGIAGSARIGKSVVMAGQSGIADHLEIGDGVTVGAKSAALRNASDGQILGGVPAIEYTKWRRQFVLLSRLEEMTRRLRDVEDRIRELEGDRS